MQNLSSAERIKKLVELEGKAARNLVTWSVPVAGTASAKESTPARSRSHSNGRHRKDRGRRRGAEPEAAQGAPGSLGAQSSSEGLVYRDCSSQTLSEREEICKYYSVKTQRQSRVTKSPSRLNLHARYWSYLFDNLHRAVDEIYRTCEADESTMECQEVIMTLDVCRKDFEALIRKIQLFGQSDLETKSSNLAWEVRKTTSPGKPRRLSSLQATPSPPPPSPLHPIPDHTNVSESKPPHRLCQTHHHSTHSQRHHPSDHAQNLSSTEATSGPATSSPSSIPTPSASKPNSARVLDFRNSGNSSKTKNSPSSFSNSPGQQTSTRIDPHKCKMQEGPTWAERVKGINSNHSGYSVKPHPPTNESSSVWSALSENGGKQQQQGVEKQLQRRSNHKESVEAAKKMEEEVGGDRLGDGGERLGNGRGGGRERTGNGGGGEKLGNAAGGDDGWETVTRGRAKSSSSHIKWSDESGTRNISVQRSRAVGNDGNGEERRTTERLTVDEAGEKALESGEDHCGVSKVRKVKEVKFDIAIQEKKSEVKGGVEDVTKNGGGGVAGSDGGGVAESDGGGVAGSDVEGVAGSDGGGESGNDEGGVVDSDGGSVAGNDEGGVTSGDGGGVAGSDGGGVARNDDNGVAGSDGGQVTQGEEGSLALKSDGSGKGGVIIEDTNESTDAMEENESKDVNKEVDSVCGEEAEVARDGSEGELLKSSSGGGDEDKASLTDGLSEEHLGAIEDQVDTERKVDPLRLEEVEATENKEEENVHKADNESWSWSDALAAYNETESYRSEMSWADRCDSPPPPMSDVLRSPGRAIHLHQRLSSPSRKRPLEMEETRRLQQEKQEKAQLQRTKLHEEKALKSKVEADKIREARESRDALARQRREALEDKLQRADMLRESHLQEIVRRAQEEEAKVSEISFINTLEAQNRKLEVQEKYQGREARLQELQDERQRRKDEQLAKEEAALERRKTIEAERHAKLKELDQRRREQEAKAEQTRLEREKAREEAAKEKAKERERRLMARNIALMTSTEELERKLQLKQDESSRRYDQQLEQKKKLATGVISSRHASVEQAPRVDAYKTKKWCTLCNVTIVSEVYLMSHLRGRKHQAALALLPPSSAPEGEGRQGEEVVIVDASEEHQVPAKGNQEVAERLQAGKKRSRKLRQRLSSKAKEFENSKTSVNGSHSKQRTRLQRALRELNKQVDEASTRSSMGGGQTHFLMTAGQLPSVDRALGEIGRALVTADDRACFAHLGGVASILKMLMLSLVDANAGQWTLSQKTFSLSLSVLLSACAGQPEICRYLVTSNKVVPLVDLALAVLNGSSVQSPQCAPQGSKGTARSIAAATDSGGTALCGPILRLLASVVSTLAFSDSSSGEEPGRGSSVGQLVMDITGYMVSTGLMDRLRDHFTAITGPIEDLSVTKLILGGLNLLVATTAFMHTRVVDVFSGRSCDDPTLLTTLLRQTELVGLMQLLYAILLSDGPPRHSHIPPPLTQHTLAIATATIKVVNNSAILDLNMVQACLGAEGISLEFRHIVSYLLWYCSHHEHPNLLHELILAVGYFSVLNRDNQVYLQSGRSPTLLQLLCRLPFQYFSNPSLSRLLYPTLISACYQMEENKAILEEEISCKLLVTFLRTSLEKEGGERGCKEEERVGEKGLSESYIQVEDLSSLLRHRFPREHWEEAIQYFS